MFVVEAEILARHNIDKAIDYVYDSIELLLRSGDFDLLDSILKGISTVQTDVGLAILVSTLVVKNKLPSRRLLFGVMQTLTENEDPRILYGLE